MKSACCWTPMTTIDSTTQGLGHVQTPNAIASAITPAVCATATSARRSESSVSGASSAALRMRRAEALPEPAALSGRRSVRNSSPWRSPRSMRRPSDQLDDLLAEVLPLQETEKRLGRRRDPGGHALAVLQLAGGDEHAELLQRFLPDLHVLADDEALDREARHQDHL